jgi:hypothetical protein
MRLLGLQPTLLRGSERGDAAVAGSVMQANGVRADHSVR